jgi:histidinol-phosphate aminotransferase
MDWSTFLRKNLEPIQAYKPGLRDEQVRDIAQTDTIYKLSSNESPLPPFPSAIAAMQEKLPSLNEYPDGASTQLVQTLASHYQVPVEQLILGNGSNELLNILTQICLEPGDNVVYCWPSFVVYRLSALVADIEFREAPLTDRGSFDLEAIHSLIDERTKIVYVCTPNNPTGGTVTAAEFDDFLAKVPSEILVVLDVAYDEFVTDEDALDPLSYFDGARPLVVLKTFSKIFSLAGIRCGYGFAPAPVVEAMNKVRAPFNVNTPAQAAAIATIQDSAELERRKGINASERARLQRCFDELGLAYFPSQANFVWISVEDASDLFDALLHKGIIVRETPGVNGLRITVGDRAGVDATIAALKDYYGK